MRIAILSDVHGNLTALDAVLEEVAAEGFDLVVSGGDVVAGPQPRECLERLAALGDRIRWVSGNADREVVEAFDGALAPDLDDVVARMAHFAAERLEISPASATIVTLDHNGPVVRAVNAGSDHAMR